MGSRWNRIKTWTTKRHRGAHRLRVGERPEAVIVLLACGVPQPQVHRLTVHHHIGRIVVKPVGSRKDQVSLKPRAPPGLPAQAKAALLRTIGLAQSHTALCHWLCSQLKGTIKNTPKTSKQRGKCVSVIFLPPLVLRKGDCWVVRHAPKD